MFLSSRVRLWNLSPEEELTRYKEESKIKKVMAREILVFAVDGTEADQVDQLLSQIPQ